MKTQFNAPAVGDLEVFRADATNLTTFNDSSTVVFVVVFDTIPLVRWQRESCDGGDVTIRFDKQDRGVANNA